MADETTTSDPRGKAEGSERSVDTRATVVSINDLAMAVDTLTSKHIRQIIQASKGIAIERIAGCGCDAGGDCGCFGSNCPCNKLHEDLVTPVSIDWFLNQRESEITRLRQELETLKVSQEQLERLKRQQG